MAFCIGETHSYLYGRRCVAVVPTGQPRSSVFSSALRNTDSSPCSQQLSLLKAGGDLALMPGRSVPYADAESMHLTQEVVPHRLIFARSPVGSSAAGWELLGAGAPFRSSHADARTWGDAWQGWFLPWCCWSSLVCAPGNPGCPTTLWQQPRWALTCLVPRGWWGTEYF